MDWFGFMYGYRLKSEIAKPSKPHSPRSTSVMSGFEFMGAKLDHDKNIEGNRKESIVSADDSKVKIVVIPTDEEIVIARDTLCIVTGQPIE